jgi:hypothetical protein
MKTTVDFYDFKRAFELCGRGDQFSRDGLFALYDYLTELERDIGKEFDLDVVALCCEWTELTWREAAINYQIDLTHCDDDDERCGDVEEYLRDHTLCCEVRDGVFLIQDF